MRAPSAIHDAFNITGNEVSLDNFSIVGREDQSMARTIREAMLPADVFAALTQSFHIGHHNIGFVLLVVIRVYIGVIVHGSVNLLASNACPVQSPYWVLAIIQCFLQVILFLPQQLLIEQTIITLCLRVLITLYLADRWW